MEESSPQINVPDLCLLIRNVCAHKFSETANILNDLTLNDLNSFWKTNKNNE